MSTKRPTELGHLEKQDHLDFQRRSWRFEEAGQVLAALAVVLALTGLFGGGPLSAKDATTPSGALQVNFPRWARNHTTCALEVRVSPAAVKDGRISVWIDNALAETIQIEGIWPTPESTELGDGRRIYHFRVAEPGEPAPIEFVAKLNAIGSRSGRVGLVDGEDVQLKAFIYP